MASLFPILTFLAILATALNAGLFFIFSVCFDFYPVSIGDPKCKHSYYRFCIYCTAVEYKVNF